MSDYVEIDGRAVYWPMCPIEGCQHRICLSLGSKYCWPHTGSGQSQAELMAEIGGRVAQGQRERKPA